MTDVQELRQFIIEASAELRAIDVELHPVKQDEREIKDLIAASYNTFTGNITTVQSTVWLGRCACGERSLGYATIERCVRDSLGGAGAIQRQELYERLTEIAEEFGPLKERRRTLWADIEAARRAIDRIEEARARPPKPDRSHSGSGQLSLI